MELGRLETYRYPGVSFRPRCAQARVSGLGAKRAAFRRYVIMIAEDPGSEGERPAGGPGPEPRILGGRSAIT